MLYFTIQNRLQDGTSKVSEAAGARWRFCVRIILGLCSNYPRIVFLLAEALQGVSAQILSFKISWQAQYLVRLEGDFTCSAHWKWRFICHADHRWRSFCVAGAIFWWGWRVTLLAPRIGNDVSYVTQIIDDIHFAWQAQYLVKLQGAFTASTHWKWRFICDADHWWRSFCVARAVFGEVAGCLYCLHALEMTFHMWRRSLMTLILRGRRSIWWSWTLTLVAPRIVNDVSK